MMNDIRARYIQDEREDARKEGKIEAKIEFEEKIITNILNEINDVDYIHKITKIPRSKIVEIAKLSSININIESLTRKSNALE